MGRVTLESHMEGLATSASGGSRIAFFDLDGTLISGYSIVALARELLRQQVGSGRLSQSTGLLRALLRQQVEDNGSSYHRLVRKVTRALEGVPEATLRELGQQAYRSTIARSLYREAIALVEAHREAGHRLVMVTAASHYQAEPVARALGIEEICCTRLEVENDCFTGQVIAPLCYGEGKTLAARRVARRHDARLADCWFYTDSSADLPLLRAVGHPVAVNPSDRLGVHARARGWPVLQFSSRGLAGPEQLLRTLLTGQAVMATSALAYAGKKLGLSDIRNANRITRLLGDLGTGFAGLEFEVEGFENLRRERPAVFVFNHQSLLDAMVLSHLLRHDVVALCKKEMADKPFIGPMLRQAGTIFVAREEQDQREVIKRALAVLASGRSLVIAPEGTRSTLGDIQPFRHGAFLLAKKARVPLVPIVLHNVKDALPKGGLLIRPATIRVTVLPPVMPDTIGSVRQACTDMEQQYEETLGRSSKAALPFQARPKQAA